MAETLDALVRRVDEDRWIASRFADGRARARLIAVYALAYEIARSPEAVSEETLGEIRLQWWREGIEALFTPGAVLPTHPVLDALAKQLPEAPLPRPLIDGMIDARSHDFQEAPFDTWADLEAYVDATAGAVIRLAALAASPGFEPNEDQDLCLRDAGRAWGYTGLVRAMPYWHARRRTFLPKRLLQHVGLDLAGVFATRRGHGFEAASRAVLDRGAGALMEAQRLSRTLPAAVFPAVAYVTLTPLYRDQVLRDGPMANGDGRKIGAFRRRLKMVGATASGSL
jgi:phytoene synthase